MRQATWRHFRETSFKKGFCRERERERFRGSLFKVSQLESQSRLLQVVVRLALCPVAQTVLQL